MEGQPTERFIGAHDVLLRAEKALALWQFSQLIAHKKAELVLDLDCQDFPYYGKILQMFKKRGELQQLLWESSLSVVTTCWVWENDAKKHRLDGDTPALIIDEVEDESVRKNIKQLRTLRNKVVAHPRTQTQGARAVAMRPTGGVMRPVDGWIVSQENTIYINDTHYLPLKNKIDYTIQEAKRIKQVEFRNRPTDTPKGKAESR